MGFPTANLEITGQVMPPEGVYTCWLRPVSAKLEIESQGCGRWISLKKEEAFPALLNFGHRPTFGKNLARIPEVHVLDFDGNLSEKTVEVILGEKLREEQTFASAGELTRQIKQDSGVARQWFQKTSS